MKKNINEDLNLELEENVEAQKDKFLSFYLSGAEYGIDISYILEIIGVSPITELPEVPDYIEGVMNLRGQVIPLIDLRTRLGMEKREYDDRTGIIVITLSDYVIGLIIDEVSEVIDIPASQIESPSSISADGKNQFIFGFGKVGESIKILLDVQKLLFKGHDIMVEEVEEL